MALSDEMKFTPSAPVGVTVIGTGDGTGFSADKTLATTAGDQPNLVITVIGPVLAIGVRFVNLFLTILVGLVAAGMTPDGRALLGGDASFMTLVINCALLSLPGAGLGLLKDLVTVFGRLEGKYPLLTGSV